MVVDAGQRCSSSAVAVQQFLGAKVPGRCSMSVSTSNIALEHQPAVAAEGTGGLQVCAGGGASSLSRRLSALTSDESKQPRATTLRWRLTRETAARGSFPCSAARLWSEF